MIYKLPNIKDEYFKMYKEKFFELNNLKVGDTVIIPFSHDIMRTNYKGKPEKYNERTECEGILKVDDNGYLYAESINTLSFYKLVNNGITGRGRREWYKTDTRKAIFQFGDGFLYCK